MTDAQLFEDAYFFNLSDADDEFVNYEEIDSMTGSPKEVTEIDRRESMERHQDEYSNGHIGTVSHKMSVELKHFYYFSR